MKLLRYLSLVILILSPLGALAQSSIDAAIAGLEKSKSVTNVVFSEQRDPSTRVLMRSNRMYNFDDNKIAAKIIEAIKKERDKSITFQMNTNNGEEVYAASFEDPKHMVTKYVLIRNPRRGWVLSIDKSRRRAATSAKKDRSDCVTDTMRIEILCEV